jgi:hypothetical protein
LLGNLPLKLSGCVSNQYRLCVDRAAKRVFAKAKGYRTFHDIQMFEEISSEIVSLAIGHLSES